MMNHFVSKTVMYAMVLGALTSASFANSFVTVAWESAPGDSGRVHLLDADLNSVSSFAAGGVAPNGVATDGNLIWAGHFLTQEIIAFDFAGVEQFRFSNTLFSGLQGLDFIAGGELVAMNASSSQLVFVDALTGAINRTIPAVDPSTEGLAVDGDNVWQIVDKNLYLTSMVDGSVVRTIPNAAAGEAFEGTGIGNLGLNELILGAADGSWYKVSKLDGSVLESGNNGLQMFGLKPVPGTSVPEGGSVVGIAGVLLGALMGLRRRRN